MNIKFYLISAFLLGYFYSFSAFSMPNSAPRIRVAAASPSGPSFAVDTSTYTRYAEPGIEKYLYSYGWYDVDTCKGVDAGKVTIETSPTYGSIRTGIVSGPMSSGAGVCAGKIINYTAAYYTSTQTTIPFQTDTFRLKWTTSQYTDPESLTFQVERQQVKFKELGTNYGWDDYTNKYLPALSVKTGSTNNTLAEITPPPLYPTTTFRSSNNGIAQVTSPSLATSFQQPVTVQGVTPATALLNARNSKNSMILGKAEVLAFNEKVKTVAVTLIHQKNTPNTGPNYSSTNIDNASITSILDSVYKQAVVKFKVIRLPAKTIAFDFNKDGKIETYSWMNKEMQAIVNEAGSAYDYNIFLVNNSSAGNCGVMEFGQKYGFIHPKPCGNAASIAHELGHGLGLSHTPSDPNNLMYNTYNPSSPNLRLRRTQWLLSNKP